MLVHTRHLREAPFPSESSCQPTMLFSPSGLKKGPVEKPTVGLGWHRTSGSMHTRWSYIPRLGVGQEPSSSLTQLLAYAHEGGGPATLYCPFLAHQLSKTSSEAKAASCTLQFKDTTPTLARNKHLELVLRAQCKCLWVLKGHLVDLIPFLPSSLWNWNKCICPSFKQNKQ